MLAIGAEHLDHGARVDVFVFAERVGEHRIFRHMREHAQLDLRVVADDQQRAAVGAEGAADLAAQLGADRDVL